MVKQRENKKKPKFRRAEYSRYKKLRRSGWRKPRGRHNKMRTYLGGKSPSPSIGYSRQAELRGLHPSGRREALVENPSRLAGLNKETDAVRISGRVGARKAASIAAEAKKLGLKILNPPKARVKEEKGEKS